MSVGIAEKRGSGHIAIYSRLNLPYTVNIALFVCSSYQQSRYEPSWKRSSPAAVSHTRSAATVEPTRPAIKQSASTYNQVSLSICMLWNSTIARKIPRGERRPNLHSDRCRSPTGGTFWGPEVFHCIKMTFLALHCVRKPRISKVVTRSTQSDTSSHIFQFLDQTYVLRLVWEWGPRGFLLSFQSARYELVDLVPVW